MGELIDDMLRLAKFARAELRCEILISASLADELTDWLQAATPERRGIFRIQPNLEAKGDPGLIRVVLENLLSNAWKYTSKRDKAVIEFGSEEQPKAAWLSLCAIMARASTCNMQTSSSRRSSACTRTDEFPGSGIGLATVRASSIAMAGISGPKPKSIAARRFTSRCHRPATRGNGLKPTTPRLQCGRKISVLGGMHPRLLLSLSLFSPLPIHPALPGTRTT